MWFPTHIASGRKPVRNNFRMAAGREKPSAPTPRERRVGRTQRYFGRGEEGRREQRPGGGEQGRTRRRFGRGEEGRRQRRPGGGEQGRTRRHSDRGERGRSQRRPGGGERGRHRQYPARSGSTGTTNGTSGRSGGPGGRTAELQPRSGESVASAVIPDLGEDMIIGTDYDALAHLLNNANQYHIANAWWKEAPFVSSEIQEPNTRRKLSKKQKREQKQGYRTNSDPTKPSVSAVPKAIMSIAGRFRQAQREYPTLKNAWQIALAPDVASVGPTFTITNDLLYRECPDIPGKKPQLVVPQTY
ncbi:hypothetical protein NDU88_004917 [Pleurodeles waltl]|uniref:Uncharacterized protein n=1 Tax=Pleurodeles waltl TaxID=8319 RepID=A0AAV7MWA7_PLEWA|nr:hypothetical protein NDU88_004917 [Pleurodeles waltl]